MAKYRLLTQDELSQFEKEFVDYLVINGITADDWEKMKKDNPKRTDEIADLFSDVVFEKIMRNVEYLVKMESQKIFAFKCGKEEIELVCIETSDGKIDFTTDSGLQELKNSPPKDLSGFQASKSYTETRELELFKMTEQGCAISDGSWYKSLCRVVDN